MMIYHATFSQTACCAQLREGDSICIILQTVIGDCFPTPDDGYRYLTSFDLNAHTIFGASDDSLHVGGDAHKLHYAYPQLLVYPGDHRIYAHHFLGFTTMSPQGKYSIDDFRMGMANFGPCILSRTQPAIN